MNKIGFANGKKTGTCGQQVTSLLPWSSNSFTSVKRGNSMNKIGFANGKKTGTCGQQVTSLLPWSSNSFTSVKRASLGNKTAQDRSRMDATGQMLRCGIALGLPR